VSDADDETSRPGRDEEALARNARSRRLASGGIGLAALLAVAASVSQLVEGLRGEESLWRGLGSGAIALWWIAVAVFLARK
jgi:hypothetical protein